MNLLELIQAALIEDLPRGDITTESLALRPQPGRALLKAKEDIVLSGALPFEQTMVAVEPNVKVKWHFDEGDQILKGQNICTLEGDLIPILKAERVALNFLGHLSGIATLASKFVAKVKSGNPNCQTKILDTRKTLPGLRVLQKKAVVHGGGFNHRLNLSDAVLLKDNHISVMGGIKPAVERVRAHTKLPVEVEARNLEEVRVAVALGVHRILLDNMSNDLLKEALTLIPATIESEASGNMTLDRVADVARLGVNYISVGALTHSAPVADVSLLFEWES
ncbi:MAG: carboxylating nicotinate-nucleotide diphosphorylase [Bdellovibrionales bacterium]|nr:carboxylating nicotinate-nucleotide diphosphorylase [Bdellovibrionales bacterium]